MANKSVSSGGRFVAWKIFFCCFKPFLSNINSHNYSPMNGDYDLRSFSPCATNPPSVTGCLIKQLISCATVDVDNYRTVLEFRLFRLIFVNDLLSMHCATLIAMVTSNFIC